MDAQEVFSIIDTEIRLSFNSKTEFAKKIGKSKQRVDQVMKSLKKNSRTTKGVSFNLVCEILEKAGYEITIVKKGDQL